MTVIFGFKRVCAKCNTDLKHMKICGVKVLYCPKCTSPKRKKFRPLPARVAANVNRRVKIKKAIAKEIWRGKPKERISSVRAKPKKKPPMFIAGGGSLSDRWITANRRGRTKNTKRTKVT